MSTPGIHRFACTRCGACCNRAPEVALSEAAGLADQFVFRLMFSLYWLPQQPGPGQNADGGFYERKRRLADFAARAYPTKLVRDGRRVPYTQYLLLSALAVDTRAGRCSALEGDSCTLYDRRPLSCRTVPLHYSRGERSAAADLAAFVASAGYRCDTSSAAPVLIEDGRIVDTALATARAAALDCARSDRRWAEAIARRMSARDGRGDLPSFAEVEASAAAGAVTVSMAIGWRIAADNGLLSGNDYRALIEAQSALASRDIASPDCPPDARDTLVAMQRDYRADLATA